MATHHEKLGMLPFRRDLPRVRRLYRAVSVVADWCSWRCPLAALLLTLAAHVLHTPTWWQVASDTITGVLIGFLFCAFGFKMTLIAVLVERPDRWYEHAGRFLSILGGLALVALGLIGAWMNFRSSFHGF